MRKVFRVLDRKGELFAECDSMDEAQAVKSRDPEAAEIMAVMTDAEPRGFAFKAPEEYRQAIIGYAEAHKLPADPALAGFIRAILERDLIEVARLARNHDDRRWCLYIVDFAYGEVPLVAWGSAERVRDWLDGRTYLPPKRGTDAG